MANKVPHLSLLTSTLSSMPLGLPQDKSTWPPHPHLKAFTVAANSVTYTLPHIFPEVESFSPFKCFQKFPIQIGCP